MTVCQTSVVNYVDSMSMYAAYIKLMCVKTKDDMWYVK